MDLTQENLWRIHGRSGSARAIKKIEIKFEMKMAIIKAKNLFLWICGMIECNAWQFKFG